MLHTFAIYVDNKPGVLNRVSSLFRRRAFNIESLTVGHTETAGVSRMTVVVDTDEHGARRLEARMEVNNLFNQEVFANPQGNVTNATFGQITGIAGGGALTNSSYIERSIRLGLRFTF